MDQSINHPTFDCADYSLIYFPTPLGSQPFHLSRALFDSTGLPLYTWCTRHFRHRRLIFRPLRRTRLRILKHPDEPRRSRSSRSLDNRGITLGSSRLKLLVISTKSTSNTQQSTASSSRSDLGSTLFYIYINPSGSDQQKQTQNRPSTRQLNTFTLSTEFFFLLVYIPHPKENLLNVYQISR